jgi:diaminopimelate decarboxylase
MSGRLHNEELIAGLAAAHGTPLYVYDLGVVGRNLGHFEAFDSVRYAVKANSNLGVLRTLREGGARCEVVSAGEIARARAAGFEPGDMVYTADLMDRRARESVRDLRLHVNAGSATMLEQVASLCGPADVTLRINPGFGEGHDEKVTTGGAQSKHGIWYEELPSARARAQELGLRVTGLHVHIGSGLEGRLVERTVEFMDDAVALFADTVTRVSCGGGMSYPYRATDEPFDMERFASLWLAGRDRWSEAVGRRLELEAEPGRLLVADAGVLVTEVCGMKSTGEGGATFVLVDAGFHSMIRPLLYGAFHRIAALGAGDRPTSPKMVAGPLCESADVFTQGKAGAPAPQPLPDMAPGELLVIHDVGAYGAAMASCYNSRPLPAEVVIHPDGEAALARPAIDPNQFLEREQELLR